MTDDASALVRIAQRMLDEPGHPAGLAVQAIRTCVQDLIALEPERLKG